MAVLRICFVTSAFYELVFGVRVECVKSIGEGINFMF